MPTFAYTARDSAGAAVNGVLVASSVDEVRQMLRADGRYPISIREGTSSSPSQTAVALPSRGIKIARVDLIMIATQIAIMVDTGVTISEALDCIAAQSPKPNVKRLVDDLARQVQEGSDFSSALARHPRSFPRLFIALIQASEKSGMLSRLLQRATAYLRDEQETLRRVKGALTYPFIMLAFAVTTTIFLLAFVLPRFTAIYAAKAAALPVPTKVLMALSNFVCTQYIYLIGGSLLAGFGFYFYARTIRGARSLHFLQLHVPLLGPMFRKMYLARSLRMLGTMAGAGVNLIDSVATTHDLCANTYFRDLWDTVSTQIQAGQQLSEPLFNSPLVPRSTAQMLSSGEKSGKLAQVMEQVAFYAEQELKEQITELTRYIEPLMIVVMGFIIGGVALALLLPIFTISKIMAH